MELAFMVYLVATLLVAVVVVETNDKLPSPYDALDAEHQTLLDFMHGCGEE